VTRVLGDETQEFGSPRLGFGCASLHGALSPAEAAALLETALDHGVTHFDTARVYGWGEAEALLAPLAQRRRDEMVIVSKAGVAPPSLAGRMVRKLGRRFAPLGEPRFQQFAPAQITRSFEQSLTALRTDRLDALLLHEIEPASVTDELKRTMEDLQRSGKALRIGIATSNEASAAIVSEHPDLCEVVQLAAPPVGVRGHPLGAVTIRHSVLGPRLNAFAQALNGDRARAARFVRETGFSPHDIDALAQLLLTEASRDGMVLFSSTKREHIIANAKILHAANDASSLQGLARFLAAA
jgi:D-threo-aldose 1-dehydrogenase